MPAKTKYQDIRKWVFETDEDVVNNSALVALSLCAELMILVARAQVMWQQFLQLQEVETGNASEELNTILDARYEDDAAVAGAVPQWMKDLCERAEKWLEDVLTKTDSIKNTLLRFLRHEFQTGAKTPKLVAQRAARPDRLRGRRDQL